MAGTNKNKKLEKVSKVREESFDLRLSAAKPLHYNALFDRNLRNYFESRRVQNHLYKTGLIDTEGRIINLERNKAKLNIIEQEFKSAEAEEMRRLKEEEEMRRRVQKKRHEALEEAKKQDRIAKLKADREIRQAIVRVSRGEAALGKSTAGSGKPKLSHSASPPTSSVGNENGGHFFITSTEDAPDAGDLAESRGAYGTEYEEDEY